MNVQERDQLNAFLQQLAQAQTGPKDEEAQALIAGTVARQPDAAYLLVQRALILDGALKVAQSQIAQLKTQLEQQQPAPAAASFLDPNAWGRSPVAPVAAPMMQSPAVTPAPAFQAAPQPAAPAAGFQAPSFLTNMAMTAAGVAAGAMLFQGVSHMLGGHNDTARPDASSLHPADSVTDNTVINNYFDTAADSGGAEAGTDDFSTVADGGADNFDSSSDSA